MAISPNRRRAAYPVTADRNRNPPRAQCLCVYGTLAPGKDNHDVVAPLGGTWTPGTIRGVVHSVSWNGRHHYPGLRLDDSAEPIEVQVLTSDLLPYHWVRLDYFEGSGYERVPITVTTAAGPIDAYVYVLIEDPSPG